MFITYFHNDCDFKLGQETLKINLCYTYVTYAQMCYEYNNLYECIWVNFIGILTISNKMYWLVFK